MFTTQCARCGKSFGAQRKTATYCSVKCRTAAVRARARSEAPAVVVAPVPPRREGANVVNLPKPESGDESLAQQTRDDLEAANRLRTPAGLLAVKLAQLLDSGVQDTGSSIAALGRQYLATLEKALDGAAEAADPLDVILNRRQSA